MFRHDVSPAIPFTVRPPFAGACMRLIWVEALLILMPGSVFFPLSQVLESQLPTTMGRTQRREKPDIGNGLRSTHPFRRQNSRYQVHAEGHFGPNQRSNRSQGTFQSVFFERHRFTITIPFRCDANTTPSFFHISCSSKIKTIRTCPCVRLTTRSSRFRR